MIAFIDAPDAGRKLVSRNLPTGGRVIIRSVHQHEPRFELEVSGGGWKLTGDIAPGTERTLAEGTYSSDGIESLEVAAAEAPPIVRAGRVEDGEDGYLVLDFARLANIGGAATVEEVVALASWLDNFAGGTSNEAPAMMEVVRGFLVARGRQIEARAIAATDCTGVLDSDTGILQHPGEDCPVCPNKAGEGES